MSAINKSSKINTETKQERSEAPLLINDGQTQMLHEHLISKDLLAFIDNASGIVNQDGSFDLNSSFVSDVAGIDELGKDVSPKDFFDFQEPDRRYSLNPYAYDRIQKRCSLFSPAETEDYFAIEFGKPGWVCCLCNNFNYESGLLKQTERNATDAKRTSRRK